MAHLLETIENLFRLNNYRHYLKKGFKQLKDHCKAEAKIKAHKVYANNHSKRQLMKKSFLGWRKETHLARKRLIEQEFNFRIEDLKIKKLGAYDRRAKDMLARIEAARRILAEEIAVKERLTLEYEEALERGVNVLSKETQIISTNPLVTGHFSYIVRIEFFTRKDYER